MLPKYRYGVKNWKPTLWLPLSPRFSVYMPKYAQDLWAERSRWQQSSFPHQVCDLPFICQHAQEKCDEGRDCSYQCKHKITEFTKKDVPVWITANYLHSWSVLQQIKLPPIMRKGNRYFSFWCAIARYRGGAMLRHLIIVQYNGLCLSWSCIYKFPSTFIEQEPLMVLFTCKQPTKWGHQTG